MVISEEHCFYPDRFLYFDPSSQGLKKEDLCLKDRINCWFIQPKIPGEKPVTIVHLHGNAENMTSHIAGSLFLLNLGYRLFTFDYQGYGRSTGRPTLTGIAEDAREVFTHIFDTRKSTAKASSGSVSQWGHTPLAGCFRISPLSKAPS